MLTIIGCGNPNRSDDGVGILVVRKLMERLQAEPVEGVRIYDAGTDGMGVMFQARGASSLILIDAARTGSEPGAIFEAPGSELEGKPPNSFTLHDFRWDHALFAGRQIFKANFPEDVSVYLVEAASVDFGTELSAPVSAAADIVFEKISRRISDYERKRPRSG